MDFHRIKIREILQEFLQSKVPKQHQGKKPTFPMDFILFKFPDIKKVLTELLSVTFRNYVKNIYIMAPKPTTLKVTLKNDQFFFITYDERSYTVKIEGKKYYLLNLGEKERAIQAIANLLMTKRYIVSRTEEGDMTGADKGDKKGKKSHGGGGGGGFPTGPENEPETGTTKPGEEPLPELPPNLTGGPDEIPGEEKPEEEPKPVREVIYIMPSKKKKILTEDALPGGKSDNMSPRDIATKHGVSLKFIMKQLKRGVQVEREHTADMKIRVEIALDHLFEDPYYYVKLATIEKDENVVNEAPTQTISKQDAADKIENAGGGIFTVTFIKKDGTERVMNCRLGVKKHLKGGTLSYDAAAVGHLPVFDIQKGEYRILNKNSITHLKIGGQDYDIQ